MTDSNIQQARDILARWRTAATPRPWVTDVSYAAAPLGTFLSANVHVDGWDVATFHGGPMPTDEEREQRARADRGLSLITTDPDLLDVKRIAAAIIAANERMTS